MYGFYIAKYILYFLAGTTTTAGCLLLYKSLKLRRSLTLGWLMITLALFCESHPHAYPAAAGGMGLLLDGAGTASQWVCAEAACWLRTATLLNMLSMTKQGMPRKRACQPARANHAALEL